MKRLVLKDGSQWPDPAESGLEFQLRHFQKSLTKSDLMAIAEIVHAYDRLIHEDWNAREKLAMIRAEANGGA